ncbi:hypothetical protein ACUXZJ_14380 [Flavobacterium sp. TN-1]
MKYQPTEEQLQEWGKVVFNSFAGFTKDDIEPLFERFIIPIYVFASRRPNEDGKWKIVNRETGKEYPVDEAIEVTKKLYQIYS